MRLRLRPWRVKKSSENKKSRHWLACISSKSKITFLKHSSSSFAFPVRKIALITWMRRVYRQHYCHAHLTARPLNQRIYVHKMRSGCKSAILDGFVGSITITFLPDVIYKSSLWNIPVTLFTLKGCDRLFSTGVLNKFCVWLIWKEIMTFNSICLISRSPSVVK